MLISLCLAGGIVKLWKLFKLIEYQLLATLILIDGTIWIMEEHIERKQYEK